MTGVLPHVHGMTNVTHGVEPYGSEFQTDLETWSERLDDLGYTNGYFGKWHVERSGQLEEYGFQEYEILRSEEFETNFGSYRTSLGFPPDPADTPADVDEPVVLTHEGYDDYLLSGQVDEPSEGRSDHYIYSKGIDFIERAADQDEPWCTVISTYAPHDPYLPPTEFRERYDVSEIPKPSSFHDNLEDKPNIYSRQQGVWDDLTWDEYAEAIACYYGYCSFLDSQVGRVRETLDQLGELEDTIILYTSDHGDYMGAHGMFLKGVPPFEEAYRVPCLVQTPSDYPDGIVRDEIVQLHDIGSTIVELAGGSSFPRESRLSPKNRHARGGENVAALDHPPSFESTSLEPFLRDRRPADHTAEGFAEFHGQDFGWTQRVYWTDEYKYVFNTFDEDELYDLSADPHELMNVIDDDEYRSVKEDCSERMWEIARETGDYQIAELHYPMHRFAPLGPNGRRHE